MPGTGLADRRILLTGASGFIGFHVASRLVALGAEVHALSRSTGGVRLRAIGERLHAHTGDVTDYASVLRCYQASQPSLVLHFAADTTARRFDGEWDAVERSLAVNLHGTLNLLRGALESGVAVSRFVRTGGLEEYGSASTPFDETQREQPVSPYSASQVAATHYGHMLQQLAPFPIVTLRPALVYGPAQSLDFFIPALIVSCLKGADFEMTGGSQRRDLLYIDDLVDAVLLAAVRSGLSGAVLNLGHGVEHEILAVAREIVRLIGSAIQLGIGNRQPGRVRDLEHLVACPARAEALLGWRARIGLTEGLQRTIEWYRDQAGTIAAPAEPEGRQLRGEGR